MARSQYHNTLHLDRPYAIQAGVDEVQNEQHATRHGSGHNDGEMSPSQNEGGVMGGRGQASIEGCEEEGRGGGAGDTHAMRRGERQQSTEGEEGEEEELWLQENQMVPLGIQVDGRPVPPCPEAAEPSPSAIGATASTTTPTASRDLHQHSSQRNDDRQRPPSISSSGVSSSSESRGLNFERDVQIPAHE